MPLRESLRRPNLELSGSRLGQSPEGLGASLEELEIRPYATTGELETAESRAPLAGRVLGSGLAPKRGRGGKLEALGGSYGLSGIRPLWIEREPLREPDRLREPFETPSGFSGAFGSP